MDIKSFFVGNRLLVGASFLEGRCVLVDPSVPTVVHDIRLPSNCEDRFDVSSDGRVLVVGYNYAHLAGVECFELATARTLRRIKTPQMVDVGTNRDGSWVLYHRVDGFLAAGPDAKKGEKLRNSASASNGDRYRDGLFYLIPSRLRGKVQRIPFEPFSVSMITLPIKRTIWVLRFRPGEPVYTILDSGRQLMTLRLDDNSVIWQRGIEMAADFAYSGDGRYMALELHDGHGHRDALVLDAASGQTIREMKECAVFARPLSGPRILQRNGEVVNLETGERDPSMSEYKWWQALGLDVREPSGPDDPLCFGIRL